MQRQACRRGLLVSLFISVTRFGEISPLWQIVKSLWLFLRVYIVLCKNFNILGKIFNTFGQIYFVVDGKKLDKLSSHLVTLLFIRAEFFSDVHSILGNYLPSSASG